MDKPKPRGTNRGAWKTHAREPRSGREAAARSSLPNGSRHLPVISRGGRRGWRQQITFCFHQHGHFPHRESGRGPGEGGREEGSPQGEQRLGGPRAAPLARSPPARPGSERVGVGGWCVHAVSGVGDPRSAGPDRPQGCPSPARPGGQQRPRSHAEDAHPSVPRPSVPRPPHRRQSWLAAAGAPPGREGARGTPGDTRPPPLPFPPPPARPSRIHGRMRRPRPRRAASPRASGAYSNPSPSARPPSPVLLSIAPSSSSLTTSTWAASGRPRPVCVSRLPNPLARASPSTSLLLLPKAPGRAASPPPANPYSGGRCSGSAAAAILNFRTPSLPPPPLGGGGGRRGAGSEPRARGRERGGGSALPPPPLRVAAGRGREGSGGKGSGWESAGLDEVLGGTFSP